MSTRRRTYTTARNRSTEPVYYFVPGSSIGRPSGDGRLAELLEGELLALGDLSQSLGHRGNVRLN